MPKAVEDYLKASDTADLDSLNACLAQDATISDVGENDKISGLPAIRQFVQESKEKFKLRKKILHIEETDDRVKVTTLTFGDFPGSPQYFYYEFTLADNLIKNIDILPGEENVKQ
jgi:ketosteroid isomerase-like protein